VLSIANEHIHACEKILGEGLMEVARDLRQVDAADLVAWLRGHRFGNVAALIASSAELVFKEGTLRFALSGTADLAWSGTLSIELDMEFHDAAIDCYFRLYLFDASIAVGITYLAVNGAPCTSRHGAICFARAIRTARRDLSGRPRNGR
jgi:hypothetical protein